MSAPVRVQLSRKRGWKMPPNTVKVDRSGKGRWGNPWRIGDRMYDPALNDFRVVETAADAVQAFRQMVDWDPDAPYTPFEGSGLICFGGFGPEHRNRKTIRAELRGKNLACWCKPGAPCHADVLLELANAPTLSERRAEG